MKPNPIVLFLFIGQLLLGQVQDKVDFTRAKAQIKPNLTDKRVDGMVSYEFQVNQDVDSIFLDAVAMDFSSVLLDSAEIPSKNDRKAITIFKPFKKGDSHVLELHFSARPKQTVYFLGLHDANPKNDQIWTQGQGKYTSHWLPSFDDMNEKVEFDLNFLAPKKWTVVSNGKLLAKEAVPGKDALWWRYDMQRPMSSYLLAFAIGDFEHKSLNSQSGIPIELYYEPKDSAKVEPTYRYTKTIFDFLEEEIGIPYPWQNYKQIPVQDFLYAGMENTGATIFSNTFMVDSIAFMDKNYVNVNAHELAHQWFGNTVTEQSGAHHWLHEGFATYYAYLAEKEIFGEDYFYWRLLETAQSLAHFSGEGNGEALTNASAGSLTFYEKGAWALVMLREQLGDQAFRQGIQNYLTKYAFQNVTIPNFMKEIESVSGTDLTAFDRTWLQESEFPFDMVKTFLMNKNESIKTYFDFKQRIGEDTRAAESILRTPWKNFNSKKLKYQLVMDFGDSFTPGFLEEILQDGNQKVQQAVSYSTAEVSLELKSHFENLLVNNSYKTTESALYRLWFDFPMDREKYLNETSGIIGMPNKNVRLLWLTLALVTEDYNKALKPSYFEELSAYTGAEHHFEVRLLAFQYLRNIAGFNDATLKNLINACSHHVWHFKKSSRKILKEFLKGEENVARIKDIYPSLSQEQQQYLDKALGK